MPLNNNPPTLPTRVAHFPYLNGLHNPNVSLQRCRCMDTWQQLCLRLLELLKMWFKLAQLLSNPPAVHISPRLLPEHVSLIQSVPPLEATSIQPLNPAKSHPTFPNAVTPIMTHALSTSLTFQCEPRSQWQQCEPIGATAYQGQAMFGTPSTSQLSQIAQIFIVLVNVTSQNLLSWHKPMQV
jgi:hypothetical protein